MRDSLIAFAASLSTWTETCKTYGPVDVSKDCEIYQKMLKSRQIIFQSKSYLVLPSVGVVVLLLDVSALRGGATNTNHPQELVNIIRGVTYPEVNVTVNAEHEKIFAGHDCELHSSQSWSASKALHNHGFRVLWKCSNDKLINVLTTETSKDNEYIVHVQLSHDLITVLLWTGHGLPYTRDVSVVPSVVIY